MKIRDCRTGSGLLTAIAAGALALGVTACEQGKPPDTGGDADSPRISGQPTGPAGATAGTMESNMGSAGAAAGPSAPGEADLAGRVKAALAADPQLKSVTVDVTASGTDVTLKGTVDSAGNRDKAAQIALNVQGVRSVENKLVVVRGS